ncbi:MAG: MDR family oxidoreductase [Gammaproteobacteria bacterium]
MSQDTFRALVLTEEDGKTRHALEELPVSALPDGDVRVVVTHSSLNYKDGLAVTGKGKIVRKFPHVPGIDLAGTVESSDSADFKPGDGVLVTGWGVGERHWGGYAELASLKHEWLTPLPEGLSARRAMAIGTAGYTAMLCVMALESHGLKPNDGPVLVTGAAGGVGSVAVALLAELGYQVTASTGRSALHDYLRELGASNFIGRDALSREAGPLEKETWAGAIDTVGGQTLATALAQMRYGAAVAACGLAGGNQLEATVFPFILRGVALLGVDSVMCPQGKRREAWRRIANELPREKLDAMTQTIALAEVPTMAQQILKGQVRGRVVVDVNKR